MRQYLLLVCLAVAFGLWPATTQAATKYWIGSSGGTFGTNSNWTTTSGSSCSSNANTTAPGTSDTAVFAADCTTDPAVSAAISVGGLTLGSGHTLDINSNNLTVSGTFSNDGTLKLNGSETVSVTMDTDSGTVEYTTNAPSGFAAGNNYYNLTFTKATGIWEQGAALDVNGNLTITSGAYDTNSNAITLAGNFSNSGTFDAGTGTVTLDGTDQTITGSTNTTFYNLTKQETSNDSTDAVLTIAASSTQTVSNTFNLDGLDSNDKLKIRSSTTGTKHTWTVSTAQTANYLDVKDSQTSTSDITCSNCTNSGSNDNSEASPHWVFSSSVSLAGTVYSDEGSTPLTSKTVRYAINGTDIDTTTSNASTGVYSFSGVTASAGDVITVYLEDESQDAVTVTVTAGSALSGINLFQDRLIVRQDNSGSLTNSNLSTAAVASENDISNTYSVSSGALTVASSKELFIVSSHTFAAGGTITVDDIDINGTLTLGSNAATVSGTWDATGGTVTSSGTVTLNGSSQTISGSTTFYNLTKIVTSAATLTFTASTTQTISNTLTLNGASGQLLSLRSSSSGTQWTINPQGTRTVSYLDVKDSNNSNSTAVACSTGCTNSGNNTNWTFGSSGSGSNTAPTATGPGNIKQATDGSGYVTFETTLADVDTDVTKLKVEYSRDGSDWKDPSLLSADSSSGVSLDDTATYQITSIDTNGGSVKVTIVWKSKSQLSDVYDDTVYLRVIPNDNTTDGSAAVSEAFAVDNQAPTVTTLKLLGRTSSSLTLGWTPGATDVNFKQYVLCYSTNSSDAQNCKGTAKMWDKTKDTALDTQTSKQTTITGLTNGKIYYVFIKAVDTFGNSSVYSSSVFNGFMVTDRPIAPTLAFSTITDTAITGSWKNGVSPTFTQAGVCYGRDRNRVNQASCRSSGDPSVSVLTIMSPSPPNFQLTGLQPSTLYYIKMVIYDSQYGTFLSSLYNQTTCPVGKSRTGSGSCTFVVTPPPQPVLTFSNITDSKIEGNWDKGVSSTFVSALICYGRSYTGVRGLKCVTFGNPNDPNGVATTPLTTSPPKAFSLAELLDGTYYYMRVFVTDSVYGTLQSPLYNVRTCEVGKSRPTDGAACRVVTVPTPSPSPSSLPSPSPTPSPEPTDEPPPIVIIENIIDKIIDIPPKIIAFIKELITSPGTTIPKARAALKPFATNPRTQVVNKVLVTTAAVSVVASTAALTSTPGMVSQLPAALSRLWQGLLGVLGLRSKKRPWGRVLDAVTGIPVAHAYVQVFDHQSHRLLSTVTSNEKGEFSSLVPPGRYEFRVTKAGWTLTPSAPLLKVVAGERIYDGQAVTVTQEKLVPLVIALRMIESVPLGKRLTGRVIVQWIEIFLARLSWPLLVFGIGLNSLILFAQPNRLALGIEVFYALLIAGKLYLRLRQHPALGIVTDAATHQPLELALVRLYDAVSGSLVETRVTSSHGQFIFLPSPGVYTISVTRDGYATYRESHVVISNKREPVSLAFTLVAL